MKVVYKLKNNNMETGIIKTQEEILSIGNIKLNLNLYNPNKKIKSILIFTHGYGEHSGYYDDFATFFAKKGVFCVSYDLRSHGLSEGKRGHVSDFELFIDDLQNVINYSKGVVKNKDVYLFGHSLGGSIVLNFLLRRDANEIKKGIVSSPWLKLAFEPPKSKLIMARIGKALFPSFVMKGELNIDHLSRNSDFKKRFEQDPLTYDLISPGYYFEIYDAGIWALNNADKLRTPVLMSHGDDDKVTSMNASKEFCKKAGKFCLFKNWENGYRHVVFSENDKDMIFDYFYSYLVQE